MRHVLCLALLLSSAPLAATQVYKWTDAQGTVHYSETPPAPGTRYQQMNLAGTASPAATSPAPMPAPSPPAPASTAPLPDTPQNRASLCASLKSNIATLKAGGPVVMQQGERQQVLDDKQRQAQLAAAESQLQQYCAQP